jgi:hypothetical protein
MTTILIKKKDTTGAPAPGDLTNAAGGAEIAVNTADKRLYTKDSGGSVVEIGTNPSDISTTTIETTNLEVTNIKAKDGTAAGSIANSTGVVTLASTVLTTTDINGGTIDGTAIGGASAAAGAFTTLNTSGAVVFNDAGADVDFRVEGDTEANLLFVDASADAVGIGTSSPGTRLQVNGGSLLNTGASGAYPSAGDELGGSSSLASNVLRLNTGGWRNAAVLSAITGITAATRSTTGLILNSIYGASSYASSSINVNCNTGNGTIEFFTGGASAAPTERLRITNAGNVGIGTSSPDANSKLTLRDGTAASLYFGSDGSGGDQAYIALQKSADGLTFGVENRGFVWKTGSATVLGGTERMRIDSSGNVGIGTSSGLVSGLTIARDTGSATPTPVEMRLWSTTNASDFSTTDPIWRLSFYSSDSSSSGPKIQAAIQGLATQAALNHAQIDFLTGTSSNANLQRVFGTVGNAVKALSIYATDGIYFNAGVDDNVGIKRDTDSFVVKTANTERARIDSSGNLLVGTTSVTIGTRLEVNNSSGSAAAFVCPAAGDSTVFSHNKATSGDNGFINFGTEASYTSRGTITYNRGAGLVAYNTTSDYRAKDISGPVENALAVLSQLKPYMGTMKGATVERPMFVAHETQAVAPYAVTGEKDAVDNDGNPQYQQMDHSTLVPLLTAAIQEQQAIIESLKARLDAANL